MAESRKMREKVARLKTKVGRRHVVKVGALNITMHPHPENSYIELLGAARRSRSSIALHGKTLGRIGVFTPLDKDDPTGPHYGEFHRYINIQVDGRWYDTAQGKQADAEDVQRVVIPANLKPEYEPFRFVFYPELHRLFFEVSAYGVGHLAPSHAQKLLVGVFSSDRIAARFGKVEVTVEPAADTVDRILSIHTLRKLKIEVTRPNSDDFSAVEREVYARLQSETAEKVQEILVAQKGVSLTPTERTKQLCRVAASNGEVVGEGRNERNRTVVESTADYPWEETAEYRSSVDDGRHTFLAKTRQMLDSLRERIRK